MQLRSPYIVSLLLFGSCCMAQTGTIKVKKPDTDTTYLFDFKFMDKCVGADKDSVIKWIQALGFKEGKLAHDGYMGNCPPLEMKKSKRRKFHCRYFITNDIDMVLTYDRKDHLYLMLIVTSLPHKFGELLSAESLAEGYALTKNTRGKWYTFTEKDRRLTSFVADKGVWYFELIDRNFE